MAVVLGKDCLVKLGASEIKFMGTWSLSGISSDQLESTSFGMEWKQYEFGLRDGGTVTFSGHLDAADTTGQEALRSQNVENGDITTLKLYQGNTSYWEPCQTSGYLSPTTTTGASTELSHVNITAWDISADKSGLVSASFTAKVSGCMVYV